MRSAGGTDQGTDQGADQGTDQGADHHDESADGAAPIWRSVMTKRLSCLSVVVTLIACDGTARNPASPACTYTYSDWGQCVDSVQTRELTAISPDGCVGTPAFTQACTAC